VSRSGSESMIRQPKTIEELHKRYRRRRREDPNEAWNEFLAGGFLITGDKTLIKRLQREAINRMGVILKKAYHGEITRREYIRRIVDDVSRKYLRELVKYEIADREFDDEWIAFYRREALKAINGEVPYKTTGITQGELMKICDKICPLSKIFFQAAHREFGGPELKETPDIYHEDIFIDPDEP